MTLRHDNKVERLLAKAKELPLRSTKQHRIIRRILRVLGAKWRGALDPKMSRLYFRGARHH